MRYNAILSHKETTFDGCIINSEVIMNIKDVDLYDLREILKQYKLDKCYILEIMPTQGNYNSLKEDLNLPTKEYRCLRRAGCENVLDVLKMSRKELKCIRGLGDKGIDTILEAVKPYRRLFDND